ncbi:hypothetical protein ACQ4PT_011809 [Festuca glaucescens]
MAPGVKLSGIQRQALALYRGFLRTARIKSPEERHRIESVVSAEFRENTRTVDRRNFVYIEYLIRRGKRQLDQLKNPDIIGLSTLKINKDISVEEAMHALGGAAALEQFAADGDHVLSNV